jgi:AcrR family transcriptional regulator
MAEAAPRWTRLERDERREQILAAARRLFSERPPDQVSSTEIARAAGVARGLLHHYFGTHRALYLEVLRSMLAYPALPQPEEDDLPDAIDRWLTMVERNREAWLAAQGAQGLGRDPEVEAILEEGRERAVDRLVAVLQPDGGPELRAVLRAYSGLAEAASLEWLVRGRLTREQTHELLLQSLLNLVRTVLPGIERARPRPRQTEEP